MSRVFISYSHDSEEHRERVLSLARRLLAAGHEVALDRFTAHPDPNWPQWMARELLAADVVLCICTPTYRARFEGTASGGFGVAWEGQLITAELYRVKGKSGRFMPVEVEVGAVPLTLRGQPVLRHAIDAIVADLGGVIGPPRPEPEVLAGWTEAASVGTLLGPIWKALRPPRGDEGYAPTQLLRAEHAVVPFLGRQDLLDDLDRWCGGGGARVRLVHGPGGAGKTRLSLEVAARRCREGWRAGPLAVWRDAHAPIEYLDALFRDKIPLFLIVDYAETRSEVLVPLLQRLARVEDVSARVLLVARAKGDWWDRAMVEVPELDRMSFGWTDVRVDEVEAGTEHASASAAVFAEWLHRPVPHEVRDHGRTPLDRQMEALVAVLGGGPLEGMPQLLRHEDRFLLNASALAGVPDSVGRLLPKLMALVTLSGGLGRDDIRVWMPVVDGLDDLRKAEARAVVELLADLYPRDGGGIDGLRPDRVGEALVAREDGDGKLAAEALDRGRCAEAVALLGRMAAAGEPRPLRVLLSLRTELAALGVVEVAPTIGGPMVGLLVEALRARGTPTFLKLLRFLLPERSLAHSDLRVYLLEVEARGGEAETERWRTLSDLAVEQAAAGAVREAIGTAQEAVSLLRKTLAMAAGPVAGSAEVLATLAQAYRAAGRYSEALAASSQSLALAESLSDRVSLATAMSNHSIHCLDSMDASTALRCSARAVEILSHGADQEAVPEKLAAALVNYSLALSAANRPSEALDAINEAVKLSRRMGGDHQEHGDQLKLFNALNNLSVAAAGVGQHEAALAAIEEAVVGYRDLLKHSPVIALPLLAGALGTLANRLVRLGRSDEALSALAEAIDVRNSVVPDQDAARHLAELKSNYSGQLLRSGRHVDARVASEEALALLVVFRERRDLGSKRTAGHVLVNASLVRMVFGDFKGALPLISQAAEVRLQLARSGIAEFVRGALRACILHACCLAETGAGPAARSMLRQVVVEMNGPPEVLSRIDELLNPMEVLEGLFEVPLPRGRWPAKRPGSALRISRRPARNAACPCGSGRRYKGCCGRDRGKDE